MRRPRLRSLQVWGYLERYDFIRRSSRNMGCIKGMKRRSTQLVVSLCAAIFCGSLAGQLVPGVNKTSAPDGSNHIHVYGRVIDDDTGKPISGARVQLSVVVVRSSCANCPGRPAPPAQPPPPRETLTTEDGSFTFENVLPRMIYVTANKDGYLTSWPIRRRAKDTLGNYETVHGSVDSIVIRLAPEATISGVLRHHDGSPVTVQPQIALMHVRSWAGFPRVEYGGWPKYGDAGTYRYSGLYPGCYYLIASPFLTKNPARLEAGRAFGEIPVRSPAISETNPNPCLTLHEGEHLKIDLTLREKELHRVTATSAPVTVLSANIEDEGGGYYRFHELYPENKFEAWLPNGRYWLDNGRVGEISGPIPFAVNGADLNDLHFTIEQQYSTWMKVPVGVTFSSAESAKDSPQLGQCGFVNAYFVRYDHNGYVQVGDNPMFTFGEHCGGAQKPATASMAPGEYTVVVNTTWLNYYVKSIRSGNFDLSHGPLNVRLGETPGPITIELAKGGRIKGSLQFEGKPAPAWVYTIARGGENKTDFRLFQPVFAKEDGTFEISGLAPGSYFIFASDTELDLNRAHLVASVFWKAHRKEVEVKADKVSKVALTAFDPPGEP